MNRYVKLGLDLLMGAVLPILILTYLSDDIGTIPAYLTAALIPVAWVVVDLLFITRRFNFITSFVGLSALVRGLLAFWFVDGVLFALKDSAGYILTVLIFGGSALAGVPIMRYFLIQHLNPTTPDEDSLIGRILGASPVHRVLLGGSWLIVAVHVVGGLANFWLNYVIVVGPFGSEAFNQQVAEVNIITRFAIGIPEAATFAIAFWWAFSSLAHYLNLSDDDNLSIESDFWELAERYENQHTPPPNPEPSDTSMLAPRTDASGSPH